MEDFCVSHNYTQRDLLLCLLHLLLPTSCPPPPPPQLTDISNVIFQTLRFEKVRENYGKMKCFITSCTRKASNVAFQMLWFEKVRENEMFF